MGVLHFYTSVKLSSPSLQGCSPSILVRETVPPAGGRGRFCTMGIIERLCPQGKVGQDCLQTPYKVGTPGTSVAVQ